MNMFNGVGFFGYQFPLPYQGMCYPSACSMEDINTNSEALASRFGLPCTPVVGSSPIVGDAFLDIIQGQFNVAEEDKEEMRGQIIGCSDAEIYSGHWKAENYIIVTLFVIIALLILLGTAVDVFEKNVYIGDPEEKKKRGLGYEMLKSFSLVENLRFIFSVSGKGGAQRFGCLEGMRSLSMTW